MRVVEDMGRGDLMTLDFIDRRPLPVRDHVVSIKDGSCEINLQKFGESIFDGMRSMKSRTLK